eukprot:31257-Pelagococcus_subviridis.AAC.4
MGICAVSSPSAYTSKASSPASSGGGCAVLSVSSAARLAFSSDGIVVSMSSAAARCFESGCNAAVAAAASAMCLGLNRSTRGAPAGAVFSVFPSDGSPESVALVVACDGATLARESTPAAFTAAFTAAGSTSTPGLIGGIRRRARARRHVHGWAVLARGHVQRVRLERDLLRRRRVLVARGRRSSAGRLRDGLGGRHRGARRERRSHGRRRRRERNPRRRRGRRERNPRGRRSRRRRRGRERVLRDDHGVLSNVEPLERARVLRRGLLRDRGGCVRGDQARVLVNRERVLIRDRGRGRADDRRGARRFRDWSRCLRGFFRALRLRLSLRG